MVILDMSDVDALQSAPHSWQGAAACEGHAHKSGSVWVRFAFPSPGRASKSLMVEGLLGRLWLSRCSLGEKVAVVAA